jgi:excisionase family DNA binding protein
VALEENLMFVAEAMAKFGLSRSTLYDYIAKGQLKRYRRVGDRRIRLDKRELERLVKVRVAK